MQNCRKPFENRNSVSLGSRGRRLGAASLFTLMSACAPFPELSVDDQSVTGVAYPRLLPLDDLLEGPATHTSVSMISEINSRVAALRARATRLQAPVIDAATRRRMERGVALP